MEAWRLDYLWPILGATAAGFLIGFEREFRGRPAGIRTHILVCVTSALLMVAATRQYGWMVGVPQEAIRIDPVRMAHGLLTGVGFLCGGVIVRHGASVQGLTTAASLWMTSGLGVLYGVAAYDLAIGGTLITLAALAGLRWFDEQLPRRRRLDVAIRFTRERAMSAAEFKAFGAELKLTAAPIAHRLLAGGAVVELSTVLAGSMRGQSSILAERLSAEPRVLEFEITPRDD